MRNMFKTTVLATVFATAAVAGSAQAEAYFEAGLTHISADIEGDTISHYGAMGVVGATLNTSDTFTHKIEGIAVIGLNSDKVYGVDVKLESLLGAAYRPSFKVSDSVELYGRVGYFHGRAKASVDGFSITESETDLGFGVGIDFSKVSLSYLKVDETNFIMATYRF